MNFRWTIRRMTILHVYADESCTGGQRYLALGGIALGEELTPGILERLKAVRDAHATYGEVKWQKISRAKLAFYLLYGVRRCVL